jgi:S1-C subfamily serine protease
VESSNENLNVIKNILKLCILLLTCILVLLVWSNPVWFSRDLPEENFVNITQFKSLLFPCEESESPESSGCSEDSQILELGESSASGIAIKSYNDKTYVLTADHFCNHSYPIESVAARRSAEVLKIFKMHDYKGRIWDANLVAWDSSKDLCLLETNMPIRKSVKFSKSMPRMGEKVFAISAPMGLSSEGMVLHFEGLFSGCAPDGLCYFTIPATGGSSGSLVYNQQGEVISMIQMAMVKFYSLSLGVGIEDIRSFLEEVQIILEIELF